MYVYEYMNVRMHAISYLTTVAYTCHNSDPYFCQMGRTLQRTSISVNIKERLVGYEYMCILVII